jgi:hypothetical protein
VNKKKVGIVFGLLLLVSSVLAPLAGACGTGSLDCPGSTITTPTTTKP